MHGLRFGVTTVFALLAAQQSYPPAFPRPGATKLLDNDRVQVWNVSWPKGQPTPLHRHVYDMTGVYYAPGDRIITAVDGAKRPVSTKAGGIVWQLKGVTHIEEGASDKPLRAVMVELKRVGPSGKVDKSTDVPAFTVATMPLLDNERVTVWDYSGPQPTSTRHRHPLDAVVVFTEGPTARALFIPVGTVHEAEAIGSATKATVFELK